MAAKRNSRTARRLRNARYKAAAGAIAALVLLALLRPVIWLYIGSILVVVGAGWMAWRLWHTDRLLRSRTPLGDGRSRSQQDSGRWR